MSRRRLVPEPGVDEIKALRGVLKSLLRRHGMRCVDIHEAEGHKAHADGDKRSTPLVQGSDTLSD